MRYIGSKNRVLGFINEVIENTYGDYSTATVADLFSGTACVGKMFKEKGAKIISNDYMYFSYALQIAKIKKNILPSEYFKMAHNLVMLETVVLLTLRLNM